jgi:hypothetical protein
MNRKLLILISAVLAVGCSLFAILRFSSAGFLADIISFPFAQIGLGLRLLSLSGSVGNIIAIILYIAICLAPCAVILVKAKRRAVLPEDSLAVFLSVLLFFIMYQMINPNFIVSALGNVGDISAGKILSGATAYSVIFAYIVLRALRLFFSSATDRLQKYMGILLALVNVMFVCLIFGVGVSNLLESFEQLALGNTDDWNPLGVSYVFLTLKFIVNNIPLALDMLIVFAGISLLEAITANRYSEETVLAAGKLSRLCKVALIITVLSNAAFNALQLLFAGSLNVMNGFVLIPLFSIAFVLAALIFSRFVSEDSELKADNDSII